MNRSKYKILFVIVDNYKTERLGIQILSSIALEEGYERQLLIINSMSIEAVLEKARSFQPQIIAYSGMTYEHFDLQETNRLLKHSGLKFISIFGGHHYTFNPEEISKDVNIDVLCQGEGEVAFRSFIRAVRDEIEYHKIEKLCVRYGNEVINNHIGSLLTDLDSIPFPDRDLIPIVDIEADHLQGKSMVVMFGRGCPQKCSYCFNPKYNELFRGSQIFRYRSVDNVITELKKIIKNHDVAIIIFNDDTFSYLPLNIIKEFCERYKVEVSKPFVVQFRAETVKEELIIMLKDAGLYLAPIGVECGNENIAKNILQRGSVTNSHIIKAFEILHKHGLETWSLNLMALPVDDPLNIDLETIKFNVELKPTWAQFNILVPIPNTPMWDYLIKHKYIDKDSFLKSNKLPSNFTKTLIKFKDPTVAAKLNNLHKFASMVVKFPFLLPLVKILIRFPNNRIYQYIFFFWYGYWKSIGSFKVKFSFKLAVNGIRAIRNYLKKY